MRNMTARNVFAAALLLGAVAPVTACNDDKSAAQTGDSVQVHYTLWLTNGTKVESSKDRTPPTPIRILLGDTSINRVIAGFEEGTIGMQRGGVRQLVVPPHLGWGAEGNPPVQPNANVVFEIEYVERIPAAQ